MKYICPSIDCTDKDCIHGKPHDHTDLCDISSMDGYGRVCPKCIEACEEKNFLDESEMKL